MANLTVILPCAVLGSICAAMLAFIWWWFPRTWNKGTRQDGEAVGLSMDAMGAEGAGLTALERRKLAGDKAREYLQAVEARNLARKEGREEGVLPAYVPQGFGGGHAPPVVGVD